MRNTHPGTSLRSASATGLACLSLALGCSQGGGSSPLSGEKLGTTNSAAETAQDQVEHDSRVAASLVLGGPRATGDNGSTNPATLRDGSVAAAELSVRYDTYSSVFEITVTNTSPVVPGRATPVLGDLYLNLPIGIAASTADLVRQSGPAGAHPGYALVVDGAPYDDVAINDTGAFGSFSICLQPGPGGGIAHADGSGTPPQVTPGPVTFEIQLIDPLGDLRQITPEFATRLFSKPDVAGRNANAAGYFFHAGDGTGTGMISSAQGTTCMPISFWSGNNEIGNAQLLFLSGGLNCHGCQFVSEILGPPVFPLISVVFDIGGPFNELEVFLQHTFLASGFDVVPYVIPNDPLLIGLTQYWQFVTNPVPGVSTEWEKSPLITTTYLPD